MMDLRMELHALSPSEALRQFKTDSEWTMKAGIGGMIYAFGLVLIFLNILFFPVIICLLALIQGYLITTIHMSVADADAPLPKWKGFIELVIGGLTWMAIESLLFLLSVGIVIGALLVGGIFHGDRILHPHFTFWAVSVWSLVMLVFALSSFFSAFRLAYFAERQEIGAAFGFAEVLKRFVRFPKPLLQAWLLQTGLFGLALVLPIATVIGVFLLPSTIFISQLFGARMLAQAWRLTRLEEAQDPPASAPQ
jgi:Protein of unknown function (DUF4013)